MAKYLGILEAMMQDVGQKTLFIVICKSLEQLSLDQIWLAAFKKWPVNNTETDINVLCKSRCFEYFHIP